MRKLSLLAAVVLLSSAWVLAQNSTPPVRSQYPSSAPAAQQPSQQSDPTQSTGGDHAEKSLEGCLAGSAGNFTLTDVSGKTYLLTSDAVKLDDHVGHQIRVTGSSESAGGATTTDGNQSSFTVKKVKMIATTCSNK